MARAAELKRWAARACKTKNDKEQQETENRVITMRRTHRPAGLFQTPTGFHTKAQGKRSVTLGAEPPQSKP